jgi:hypothetical protein
VEEGKLELTPTGKTPTAELEFATVVDIGGTLVGNGKLWRDINAA